MNKLSGLLRSYPEIPQITQESRAVAARLIALLPRGTNPQSSPQTSKSYWTAASSAAGFGILVALGVLISLQFANQAASRHQARADAMQSLATHNPPPAPPP